MDNKIFYVFTDGSSLGNGPNAPAGSAVLFPSLKKIISQRLIGTNNMAELSSVRLALWFIENKVLISDCILKYETIIIYSDSEYSINAVTGKNTTKVNKELIDKCKEHIEKIKEKIKLEFKHVSAHTGKEDFLSKCNDIVDKIAKKRAEEKKQEM